MAAPIVIARVAGTRQGRKLLLWALAGFVALVMGVVGMMVAGVVAAVAMLPTEGKTIIANSGGWAHPLGEEFIWDTYADGSHVMGAVDFPAPQGHPVYTAGAGNVVATGWMGTYGQAVTIQHADGTATHYAHLSAIYVAQGAQVAAGEQIGLVGKTGGDWGPHLHFEARANADRSSGLPAFKYMAERGVYLGRCYGGPCEIAGY